jgi:hypothetical protein
MSNKTVTITLPDAEYAQLKELAEEQDRYISGQARHMLREELRLYQHARELAETPLGPPGAPEDRTASHAAGCKPESHAQQEPLPG